jgi:RNA recognition motif-containing protein
VDVGEQIELKRNFGFVQFSAVEEATRALEALNGTKVPPSLLPGLSTPNLGV